MRNTSRIVRHRIASVTAVILGCVCSQNLSADPISKAEYCLLGASSASKTYEVFKETEKKRPDLSRDIISEGLQLGIYQAFQKEVDIDTSSVAATVADFKRGWRSRGIKDYLANPALDPATYERVTYEACMGRSQ